jgi:hypothetical protein
LWIFSSNKSASANRKKGFYTNHVPKNQEDGGIFEFSGSELWTLFKYSRSKLKNQTIAVFKATQWHESHADLIWPEGTFKKYTGFFFLEFIGPIMIFKEVKMGLDVWLWRMIVWMLYERK